jgi:hypothetical protein
MHDTLQCQLNTWKSPKAWMAYPLGLVKLHTPCTCSRPRQPSHITFEPALVSPLTTVFNHFLDHSLVPGQWSATIVILLFKKGDPTLWGATTLLQLCSCCPAVRHA